MAISDPASRQQLNNSDRAVLTELYDHYGSMCYRAALATSASQTIAEDAVQEVFVRLSRDPRSLFNANNPCGYLVRMAQNAAIDLLRARRHRPLLDEHAAPASSSDGERCANVARALASLPCEQRLVVVLRIWEGRSLEDIAAALDISPNTVASRWRYATEKLCRLLANERPYEPSRPPHVTESYASGTTVDIAQSSP